MSPSTRRILEQADAGSETALPPGFDGVDYADASGTERPPDFDWMTEMARVRHLLPRLEQITGFCLSIDDSVQDASFLADVHAGSFGTGNVRNRPYLVRISNFGRLATLGSEEENRFPASDATIANVRDFLGSEGYTVVDSSELSGIYDGVNAHLRGRATWWVRFFDYL